MANLDAEAKGQTRDGKDEKLNAKLEVCWIKLFRYYSLIPPYTNEDLIICSFL